MIDIHDESIQAFSKVFPDEGSCKRWILDACFGIGKPCQVCGGLAVWRHQGASTEYFWHCCRRVYPRAETLAAFTSVPLRTWFLAILLVSNFDGRVGTEFLVRHLGLGHKVARRMSLRIRIHMTALALQETAPLDGPVYVDEMHFSAVRDARRRTDDPVVIFGIANKADVRVFCVPNRKSITLAAVIQSNVVSGSKIVADGLASYDSLVDLGFQLSRVNHTKAEWRNSEGYTTTRIEQVWSGLRRRLEGVHVTVPSDKLWTYLGQHMFLLRCRERGLSPFWQALSSFPNVWELGDSLRERIDLR